MSSSIELSVGAFDVVTTSNKGHDVEFWAETASVGNESHPVIAQQAEAFKQSVLNCVTYYMKEALKSDRTTLCGELEKQGQSEMAEIIRRL